MDVYSYHGLVPSGREEQEPSDGAIRYHTLTSNKSPTLPNEPPVEIPDIDGTEDVKE